MRSIAAISVNIAGEDILIVLATPRSTTLPLITIWLDYLSLDSAWLELECHWHELHTKCEIYSEIIQFVIIILDLKYNSLSQCHYLWLRTLTAALFYIFQAPSMLSKDIWRIFLILFRLSSVGLWIIARVWLDWTLAGEWFKDKNDCLINCWGWVVRKYGGQNESPDILSAQIWLLSDKENHFLWFCLNGLRGLFSWTLWPTKKYFKSHSSTQ